MIGVMSNEEVQSLLRRKKLGRIAMSANDRPYVTPINFAYDGECVYCCSSFGRKVATMREQPLVCFEVEEIDDHSNWRTVIAEGMFEEITDAELRKRAIGLLANGSEPVSRALGAQFAPNVLFRIRLTEISGRFERRDA
jgi:nitroimidazol reductase NimA-like FMN-containing flavoprotein (pyridoxamine 5'-phosphate oxidase superfamily)